MLSRVSLQPPSVLCLFLSLLSCLSNVQSLRNGLGLTPMMGWSNWEAYGCDVNETIIKANADAVVAKGLLAAGYNIVGVDDCWAEFNRSETGHLVPNGNFSSGMKSLGDYLHAQGLQFGIYSSAGEFCCQHTMPGSLGYEWIDAQDFAAWGVDYLKYDGCFMEGFDNVLQDSARRFPFTPPPILRYPQMAMALNKTGRNISYLCNFPWQFWSLDKDPADGGDWVGEFCNAWRTGGDAGPGYHPALGYVDQSEKYASRVPSGPGRWNHLDSLEIGNNKSNFFSANASASDDPSGMTEAQEQLVFSLFVTVKSPLFIGASAVDLSGHSLRTYLNTEVIAVHQDKLGARGGKLPDNPTLRSCGEAWSVRNADGGVAVVLANRDPSKNCSLSYSLEELPGLLSNATVTREVGAKSVHDNTVTVTGGAIRKSDGKGQEQADCFAVRDLWKHSEAGRVCVGKAIAPTTLPPTSCVMLRLTPQ